MTHRPLDPVRITGGPYRGRRGHYATFSSDRVYIRILDANGPDLVEVDERNIEWLS